MWLTSFYTYSWFKKKQPKKKTKHQLHCPALLYNILNLRISTQSYVMGNQIQFITACNKNDFLFRLQGNISKDNVIFFYFFSFIFSNSSSKFVKPIFICWQNLVSSQISLSIWFCEPWAELSWLSSWSCTFWAGLLFTPAVDVPCVVEDLSSPGRLKCFFNDFISIITRCVHVAYSKWVYRPHFV